jgi:hypothetical protein
MTTEEKLKLLELKYSLLIKERDQLKLALLNTAERMLTKRQQIVTMLISDDWYHSSDVSWIINRANEVADKILKDENI